MLRLLIVFFLFCFLLSCGSNFNKNSQENLQVLKLSHLGQDPKTFNPWTSDDASSSMYGALMFDSLWESDPDTDETKVHMAKSYEISGNKITVRLREDLFWSDEKKINADDVIFTFNELLKNGVALSSLKDILLVDGLFPEIKKLDEFSIEFKSAKPFAPFLKSINIPIAPKHHIEKFFQDRGAVEFSEKQKLFNDYLSIYSDPNEMVVSGPFKFKKLISGEKIIMEKNPFYFKNDDLGKDLPYLDGISYNYVQDSNSDIFKFLAKESDLINISPQNASFIKNLEKKYDFTLYDLGASTGTNFLWFNLSESLPEPKKSWFRDKNFRKAISYGIDRESIVNNVFQGLAEPLFTAESLKSPFLNTKLSKGHPHDINKAIDLLKSSGFSFKEGQLLDRNGNKVEFSLFTNAGNLEREMICTIIVSNLESLGIKVNFKPLEFNNFVSKINSGKGYEAGVIGLTGSNEPHHGANVWKSDGRLHLFHVREKNEKPWDWERRIDDLFSRGVKELEFNKRKEIYDEFQEIVYEEMPLIYLVSPKTLVAARNNIEGIRKTKYSGIIPRIYELKIKQ